MKRLTFRRRRPKKYFSIFRHPFLFFLSELSSQTRGSTSVYPEIPLVPANGLHFMNSEGSWSLLRGLNTVGEENGIIVGIINRGRIRPIYDNYNGNVINIQLLGLRRIELSSDQVRRFHFGRKFRHIRIVHFI